MEPYTYFTDWIMFLFELIHYSPRITCDCILIQSIYGIIMVQWGYRGGWPYFYIPFMREKEEMLNLPSILWGREWCFTSQEEVMGETKLVRTFALDF